MLSFFRKIQHSFFIKLILALTALSFVSLFGVSSYLRPGRNKDVVASVGKTKITVGQIREELEDEIKRLNAMYDTKIDTQTAIKTGVVNSIIKKIISRTVLNNVAQEMGIQISDSSLKKETYDTTLFHDLNGHFDRAIFQQMLRLSGITEKQYFTTLKGDLARKHLLNATQSNPPVPMVLAQNLYKYRNEKRRIEIIELKSEQQTVPVQIDEKTLKDYYEKHKQDFIKPEYRKLTAVYLSPQNIAKKITIDPNEAKEIYENELTAYIVPEERKILQMRFELLEPALDAKKLLDEHHDFFEVAQKSAGQTKEETELGWLTSETTIAEMQEAVFNAEKGEVVGPKSSQFGWHIMKIEELKPKKVTAFEEVKAKIIADLKEEKAIDLLYAYARKLEDLLGRGTALTEAAKEGDFELITINAIDDKGLSPQGQSIDNSIISPLFLQKAFELLEGEESLLIEDEHGFFVVKVEQIIPSEPKELKEIKNQITQLWKADQHKEAAQNKANRILSDLEKGQKSADAAKTWNVPYKISPAFIRTEDEQIPAAIATQAFTLDENETSLITLDDGFAVITLKEIIPAKPENDFDGVMKLAERLEDNIAEDLGSAMIAALSQKYPIKINQSVIDKAF